MSGPGSMSRHVAKARKATHDRLKAYVKQVKRERRQAKRKAK